mgnify:CR=1 FL=1
MRNLFGLSAIVIALGWYACSPADTDSKPPSLLLSSGTTAYGPDSICGVLEQEVFALVSSESLKLEMYMVDDEALSQLKIDIHDNYDCHGHSGKTDEWYLQKIIDLSGNEERITESIPVPENVKAGSYHLGLQLIDAAGNEAEPLTFNLKVLNVADIESPRLRLNEPTATSLNVKKGDVVRIEATIEDNKPLSGGGMWSISYRDENSGNFFDITEQFFDDNTGIEAEVFYDFTVPTSWTQGIYEVVVMARDAVNNASGSRRFKLVLN